MSRADNSSEPDNLAPYFAGEKLYGDDFSRDEIVAWFEDEREGYAGLGAEHAETYRYVYHALNQFHGFRFLPDQTFHHALGFGSAYGDEFVPVAERIEHVTILEPSEAFVQDAVHGIPATYVKPHSDGTLPFAADTFDLITCLGVLHHIPNVSYVVSELSRCLHPDGFALLREPIISMGDWRHPRPGLTKHERGIPLSILLCQLSRAGFIVVKERLCMCSPLARFCQRIGVAPYNNPLATRIDYVCSLLLKWNWTYHATAPLKKFRPVSAFYVLRKAPPPDGGTP